MTEAEERNPTGGSEPPPGAPDTRSGVLTPDAWPWLLLGLGLLGVAVASWRPVPAGVWHDDGTYMLIGKALAEGHGFTYRGVAGAPPASKFPPVYPLTLAAFWTLARSLGTTTLLATFLNLGLIAVAGALFGRFLHRDLGMPVALSAATAAVGFASTDLLRTGLIPLSEPLFLLLVVLALTRWRGIAESIDGPDGGGPRIEWGTLAVPALILFALVATRSAGLAVVVAFGIAIVAPGAARGRPARRIAKAAAMTAPAILFMVSWGRWSAAATDRIPEGARDLLGPYQGWLSDQVLAAPTTFLAELPSHAAGVLGRAIALLVPGVVGPPMWLAGGVLLAVAALGTGVLMRRFPPIGWTIVLYLGMLLVWPYLDRRLLVPIHPLLVAAIAVGGSALAARATERSLGRRILLGLAAVWVLGYSTVTAYRIADGWPTAPYRVRAESLAAAVEALTRTVPPEAVVGAPEFWAALHLHGGWIVAPSVRFDPRSIDPDSPMWGTADEQLSLWRASRIDHLLLEQGGQLHGAALDQLETACPGSVFVLAQMRAAMVVKLEWDPGCNPTPPSTPRSP